MLQLVRDTWIKNILEQSLHGTAMLELGKEYSPDAVERPWDIELHMPCRERPPMPHDKPILELSDECSDAPLILGEPGSGKTTTLLELAQTRVLSAELVACTYLGRFSNLCKSVVIKSRLVSTGVSPLRMRVSS